MRDYIVIVFVCITLGVYGCKMRTQNNSITEIKTEEYIRKVAIQDYFKNGNILSFPVRLDAMTEEQSEIDSLISNNPIIGCFPDTSKYYGVLTVIIGDILYPTIETYDKRGRLLQKEIIATANCINPVADIESCFDSIIIMQDLTFNSYSRLEGTMEDLSDTTDNPPIYDICQKQSISGKILSDGQIEVHKSEKVRCED